MDYLYICNTGSDCISKIRLDNHLQKKIPLKASDTKAGPHGICLWKSDIIVANSYSNSISKIDIIEDREVDTFYIGVHCNDVAVYNNLAYIVCGESNGLVIFDLYTDKIIREIPCENMPHSINIYNEAGIGVIANMGNDSISLIDCKRNDLIKNIRTGHYPTKAMIIDEGEHILVCESNIGLDINGRVAIFSLAKGKLLSSIEVGKSPVDVYYDSKYKLCYVSNFIEGTLSIIDLIQEEEINRVYIGGMPRGIVKYKNSIYIGDNYRNNLIRYDIISNKKIVIPVGKEPNGMTMV